MNEEVMGEITEEERRCLRMWFRHAIVELERQEVGAAIEAEQAEESAPNRHRYNVSRRRIRRNRSIPHLREMVF